MQLTVTCSQMWFVDSLKHLHQMFKRSRKSNSNLFSMNLPQEPSSQKIILFSALPGRLLVFSFGIWAQTVILSKNYFISEIIMYRV